MDELKQWNLIRLRKEENMTQEDAATLLDMSLMTYCRKENGQTPFLDVEMFKLRERFKRPMDEIFLPPNSIDNRIDSTIEPSVT